MFFSVLSADRAPVPKIGPHVRLIEDNWNDWFEYTTLYHLEFIDSDSSYHSVGGIKIGQFGMPKGQSRAGIPDEFDVLDESFFSLGQDDSYYETLNSLGPNIRDKILQGLRDLAYDLQIFDRAMHEPVTERSLLRSVSSNTVRGQFNRIAHGGARLSEYEFLYTRPVQPKSGASEISLDFSVKPESQPPTNIHVLIGRNGVGKTHLLNSMTRALVEKNSSAEEIGTFSFSKGSVGTNLFANTVSVTFSAFDRFILPSPDEITGVKYFYVGLRHENTSIIGGTFTAKDPNFLAKEFIESLRICRQGARLGRWHQALVTLETDPNFKDAQIIGLAEEGNDQSLEEVAFLLFEKLSSGHKIVLLTITKLVEALEERTLVLLDEPEAHLHPPLLSAFVRALSDLLVNRNGVAIIATHSPVVLQEVPRNCVWKIRRVGRELVVERPELETFGENIGVLTREVFGFETTYAGFHKLLADEVKQYKDYKLVLARFQGQLGEEAKAIVRGLVAATETEL